MQVVLHRGHQHDALENVLNLPARLFRLHGLGLQRENAGHEVGAVSATAPHLLQQGVLLPHQLLHLPFHDAPLGHVGQGEEDVRSEISAMPHPARAQAQGAPSDGRKLALDLIAFHLAMLRQDLFQQHPQLGDVPLILVQLVDEPALGALAIEPECPVEGPAGGHDAKIAVEHDHRLGDRIHDGQRQDARVLDAQEGLNVGHDGIRHGGVGDQNAGHDMCSFDLTPTEYKFGCAREKRRAESARRR
jgi:hypothetical protein